MRHPWEAIQRTHRRWIFVPILCLTLATGAILLLVDRHIPPGIVAFELARDADLAASIVARWDPAARAHAGFSLGLDYLYLCAYSSTIGLASVMLGSALRDRNAMAMARWAAPIAWLQWLAASFDAVENAALLHTLTSDGYPRYALVAWVFACGKFALVAVGLGYVIGAGVMVLARRRRG